MEINNPNLNSPTMLFKAFKEVKCHNIGVVCSASVLVKCISKQYDTMAYSVHTILNF